MCPLTSSKWLCKAFYTMTYPINQSTYAGRRRILIKESLFLCTFMAKLKCTKMCSLSEQETCAIAKMIAQCPHATYTWMPWNFRVSLTTPIATIPNIFHGLLFRSKLWMFVQNLKSVALPIPEIIGGTQNIWAVPGYAHAHFLLNFEWAFIRNGHVNISPKFEVRSFTCSRDKRG